MNQKNLKWVVAVAALVFIIGGAIAIISSRQDQPRPTFTSQPNLRPTVDEQTDSFSNNWQTYQNITYNYQLRHPKNITPSSEAFAEPENVSRFVIWTRSQPYKRFFEVVVPSYKQARDLSLVDFTKFIWQINKNDSNPATPRKTVGEIKKTAIRGRPAYQFSLTDSYSDPGRGTLLKEEFTYIFTEHNNLKYIIGFPSKERVSWAMLESLRFSGAIIF